MPSLDDRFDYGEVRFVTFGILEGLVVAVAHTETDEPSRIISARLLGRFENRTGTLLLADSMLWYFNEVLLFFITLAAFLVVIELGFRLGRNQRAKNDDPEKSHLAALQAALLGLLALLLGFSFAMAASRFEARKALVEDEVNAIYATWLRAKVLPALHSQEATELVRRYAGARVDFFMAGDNAVLIDAASDEALQIQEQLWAVTAAMMSQESDTLQKQLFVQSLNDMITVSEKRRAALDNHVPEVVLHLLFTVAVGSLGFIAFGYGLTGKRRHISTAIFALLIALVLTTIIDLDEPRSGFIKVGEESMLRLQSLLGK